MRVGEEADEQRADETTDEVDADDVEAVVEAELVLQADRERAAHAGDETDDQGAPGRDRAQAGVMATRPATMPEAAPSVVRGRHGTAPRGASRPWPCRWRRGC